MTRASKSCSFFKLAPTFSSHENVLPAISCLAFPLIFSRVSQNSLFRRNLQNSLLHWRSWDLPQKLVPLFPEIPVCELLRERKRRPTDSKNREQRSIPRDLVLRSPHFQQISQRSAHFRSDPPQSPTALALAVGQRRIRFYQDYQSEVRKQVSAACHREGAVMIR